MNEDNGRKKEKKKKVRRPLETEEERKMFH